MREACSICIPTGACILILLFGPIHAEPRIGTTIRTVATPRLIISTLNPGRVRYALGDVLERRISLTAPPGFSLDRSSVPHIGRQSAWFTLLGATIAGCSEACDARAEHRYQIHLRYQVDNAPTAIRRIALPALHIDLKPNSRSAAGSRAAQSVLAAEIGSWSLTIAPTIPLSVPLSIRLLRPDHLPRPISTVPSLLIAGASAALAALLVAGLIAGPYLRRRNGPFARAHRALWRLIRHAPQEDSARRHLYPEGLLLFHRALNETAGWSVFRDRLGLFSQQHPELADLHSLLQQFLGMSRHEFFEREAQCADPSDDEPTGPKLRWLLALCRQCRERERDRA